MKVCYCLHALCGCSLLDFIILRCVAKFVVRHTHSFSVLTVFVGWEEIVKVYFLRLGSDLVVPVNARKPGSLY